MLALLLLPTLVMAQSAKERQQKADTLKQLRSQITTLTRDLQKARGEESQLARSLRKTERAIDQISRDMRLIEGRQQRESKTLSRLKQELSGHQQQLQQQQTRLRHQLRSAYVMGQQGQIKLLLNQQEPATVGRMMVYYDYISRARSREIENMRESLTALQQVEQQITQRLAEIDRLKQEADRKQLALQSERAERKETLKRLKAEITSSDRQLVSYKKNEKQLELLLKALDQALADIPERDTRPFNKRKGKLSWPTKGRLAARFGTQRPVGNLTWRGVLIDSKEGSTVNSISQGRVAYADWLRGFGLLIIIDHGGGYMSLYGHNRSLFKEAGDWVETGDSIASVGDSGGQDRPGLYFEIRHKGKPINPVRWCRRVRNNRTG
ncbi:hypothetical protein BOW53_10805 [Solemya pervernicosa gill symbiont]|uniref:M23ase beta-sheet core domain-containing protein n=1 Tax=Solemya pervernicosa gill symbiont TaxID=642797 RepID=A0A1T2L3I6_9GAMM|nr:hypothetical protein BOW53_10805 [Solemya pervernicosa gill symbiont]